MGAVSRRRGTQTRRGGNGEEEKQEQRGRHRRELYLPPRGRPSTALPRGGLHNRKVFSPTSGGWKSKTKPPAGWAPSAAPLLGV